MSLGIYDDSYILRSLAAFTKNRIRLFAMGNDWDHARLLSCTVMANVVRRSQVVVRKNVRRLRM